MSRSSGTVDAGINRCIGANELDGFLMRKANVDSEFGFEGRFAPGNLDGGTSGSSRSIGRWERDVSVDVTVQLGFEKSVLNFATVVVEILTSNPPSGAKGASRVSSNFCSRGESQYQSE